MALYQLAKNRTDGNEGLWANNPNDDGGETWVGIARGPHPAWKGWPIIDDEKRRLGKQPEYGSDRYKMWVGKLNAALRKLPLLTRYVNDFYRANFWEMNRLDEVRDQAVAEYIYDHAVNAGARGIEWLQEALRFLGYPVAIDGAVGPKTLAAINGAEPVALLREMEDVAAFYRLDRAADKPSQIQFLPSWLKRDGCSREEIDEVMKAAKDGLTYTEVAVLKKMIDATA